VKPLKGGCALGVECEKTLYLRSRDLFNTFLFGSISYAFTYVFHDVQLPDVQSAKPQESTIGEIVGAYYDSASKLHAFALSNNVILLLIILMRAGRRFTNQQFWYGRRILY